MRHRSCGKNSNCFYLFIVDLAGILGFHSMLTQEQYHAAMSTKWGGNANPTLGWDGITKATPLKWYPPEEPNRYAKGKLPRKCPSEHKYF